ncbi:hypothetical protein [Cellvibrio mixtus]|uniref:hypothetical protein n=1 Tax=Cellvibrio mixtus TaxID=39650 RepID=UPI000694168E|nr:hypothetical protein [Cellvibrio mixtus]
MKIIMRCWWLLLLLQPLMAHAELVVSHRSPYAPGDTHHLYSTALLQLALEKTRNDYGDFRLNPIPPRNYTRALKALVDNAYPNLVIETSYEQNLTQNSNLNFINFPMDLGVLGYRVCFMNPKLKKNGLKIDSLQQLSQYSFAHGVGWADTLIFRHNGLKVREIDNYDSIFLMVIGGRVDFFCRGVNEILGEVEQFSQLNNLVIDDHFMLVYPLPRFFYLNSKNVLAKERIEEGLKRAYMDGSLQTLWKAHYHTSLDYVRLKGRKIIALENPLLGNLNTRFTPDFIHLLDNKPPESQSASQTVQP